MSNLLIGAVVAPDRKATESTRERCTTLTDVLAARGTAVRLQQIAGMANVPDADTVRQYGEAILAAVADDMRARAAHLVAVADSLTAGDVEVWTDSDKDQSDGIARVRVPRSDETVPALTFSVPLSYSSPVLRSATGVGAGTRDAARVRHDIPAALLAGSVLAGDATRK